MKLTDLTPNPDNPRHIRDEKFSKLVDSIRTFDKMMRLRPMVVDMDGVILGGNMRYRALQHLGMDEIPDNWVIYADLTEEEKREFIIKDNVAFGEWDWETLANDWDEPMDDWGLDVPDVDNVVTGLTDEDDVPEVPEEPITKPGDLWILGEHRVLCGDSTKAEDVERLMGGNMPKLMVTDPPYGVNYDANWRNLTKRPDGTPYGASATGKVTNDDRADWTEAYSLWSGKVAYVWHAGTQSHIVGQGLIDCELEIRSMIVWAKNVFAIGRSHYHEKKEPCFYAVRKGENAGWIGDRKQTTLWEIDKPRKSETGHSTQKPIECMEIPLRNHEGDVYDPFLGSGTTLIAAEKTGRKCYGMELDPKYCDVIVKRWEDYTGKKAQLEKTS